MYMSYCRFEGTLSELLSCIGAVEEHVDEEAEYPVSDREIDCFRLMIETVFNFFSDTELLSGDYELDYDALENVCEKMAKGYVEE